MAEPFLGEICIFSFANGRVPTGWHLCDGALLPIAQYSALYALIGTTYGGNGSTNFALPDLRSRVPVGYGQGTGLTQYGMGQQVGVERVTLDATQIPTHTHLINVSTAAGSSSNPQNNYLAKPNNGAQPPVTSPAYASTPVDGATLAASTVAPSTGGGLSHNNVQPVLGLMYCIAMQGIFPTFD